MSTSGTHAFNPRVAECLDEAWERCGLDPATITARHTVAAIRSLNLLLRSELSDDQINLWKVATITTTPIQGASSYTLPVGVIDVLEAVTRDTSGSDVPMVPIGRSEWIDIPDKTQQGRPDRYWVDRTVGQKTLHFWPAMGTTSYSLLFNALYGIQDAGDLANEADLPDLWYDVVCAGLAKRLALKYAADRSVLLEAQFSQAHRLAKRSNIERGSLFIEPTTGSGRHAWGRS